MKLCPDDNLPALKWPGGSHLSFLSSSWTVLKIFRLNTMCVFNLRSFILFNMNVMTPWSINIVHSTNYVKFKQGFDLSKTLLIYGVVKKATLHFFITSICKQMKYIPHSSYYFYDVYHLWLLSWFLNSLFNSNMIV